MKRRISYLCYLGIFGIVFTESPYAALPPVPPPKPPEVWNPPLKHLPPGHRGKVLAPRKPPSRYRKEHLKFRKSPLEPTEELSDLSLSYQKPFPGSEPLRSKSMEEFPRIKKLLQTYEEEDYGSIFRGFQEDPNTGHLFKIIEKEKDGDTVFYVEDIRCNGISIWEKTYPDSRVIFINSSCDPLKQLEERIMFCVYNRSPENLRRVLRECQDSKEFIEKKPHLLQRVFNIYQQKGRGILRTASSMSLIDLQEEEIEKRQEAIIEIFINFGYFPPTDEV
ncbi:MAG: hypothetical protein LBR92_01105 [Puniceicoccales bacterium]|jgi:hypothetical protein|nr:hypothetical protein [Puniceicoccales bacterium]